MNTDALGRADLLREYRKVAEAERAQAISDAHAKYNARMDSMAWVLARIEVADDKHRPEPPPPPPPPENLIVSEASPIPARPAFVSGIDDNPF